MIYIFLGIRRPWGGGGRSRRNIAMALGSEKQEWRWYPTVKSFEDKFIRFDRMYERDTQTDTQTPRDG